MKRDEGFILVTVLWLIALLSLIMVVVSQTLSQAVTVAGVERAALEARATAESGLEIAAAGLLTPDAGLRWVADGRPYRLTVNNRPLVIRAVDTARFIDINRADLQLIANLLRGLGAAEGVVEAMTAELKARRTRVDTGGTQSEGLENAPRERTVRPFLSTAQFIAPFAGEAVAKAAAAMTTVFSRDGRINPMQASREVLLAVPGIAALEVEALLDARDKGRVDSEDFKAIVTKHNQYFTTAPGNVFRVSVKVEEAYAIDATILLDGSKDAPFHILSWE